MKKISYFKMFVGIASSVEKAVNEFFEKNPGLVVITCTTSLSSEFVCVSITYKMY